MRFMEKRAPQARRHPEVLIAVIARSDSDEAIQPSLLFYGLLRCARTDEGKSRPLWSPAFDGAPPRRARHARMNPVGGLKAWVLRGLGSARQLHQHAQRLDDGALAHRAAADRAEAAFAMQDSAVAGGDGEMHETHGLARRRTSGTGDAGNGNGKIDAGLLERADRHRGRGL